ncbi:response regulator transcription factor [Paraclostridium bifermentans]|uniref:response regulator transcription factor n=1 Tax=Paraclostridium TaxID=1849822 RepID=UPI00038D7E44|nr:response regulator transcription factor [Paraclostridium bifermentans]MDV8113805.1 response regulator transcription factor [Bacillus sp. BAU-SS-2023]EQK39200.1 response regulator [[Clostridium] bifermentans ATCC 19299] [Paraclostridium bifermentans ATCC 19299]MCR1875698.1 response regulator transcription factor [Paraclostridium bifermentans]TQO59079.1 DNA-binding response regulator [Paraclostridium bifermentans]GIM31835.1 DNA-binding response regulator [Paraclostridium bifermentans subsp. m
MHNILVVDDEKEIVELIELYFRSSNYKIFKAYDGIEAINIIDKNDINLAIVDIMMPNLNGYSLIQNIRSKLNIPIIVISAKVEGYDKILALDMGADDYVTKPFDPLELVARVNAQIRRVYGYSNLPEIEEKLIQVGDLKLDLEAFKLTKNNKEIPLTSTELKIVELFMKNPNKVFTKKNLFESVWDEVYIAEDNAIMVQISKIRDKIEDTSKEPKYIKTIRGIGYKFESK